jgi:hypothetical protein
VAAQLAHELKAPLTFIHVRPRPPAIGGSVRSQRRSVRALFRGQSALDAALSVATRWGVMAHGEIVDGNPVDELVRRPKEGSVVARSRRQVAVAG